MTTNTNYNLAKLVRSSTAPKGAPQANLSIHYPNDDTDICEICNNLFPESEMQFFEDTGMVCKDCVRQGEEAAAKAKKGGR
jgi:hypothetical protein